MQERITGSGAEEVLNYYYSPDGKLLEIGYRKGDEKEYHYSVIRNAPGDIVALYTAEGTLVGTYEYDPYGKLLAETPNEAYDDTDGILAKNPFRYRGYYYDRETGWYYLQSRYYDPEVKRFINADSTDLLTNDCDNMMQYNLFMYCNGDPVNYVDPSGHFSIEDIREWARNNAHPIFFVSTSLNSATGASLVGGYQKVIDPFSLLYEPKKYYGEQYFGGAGVSAGAGEKIGMGIGMIFARHISDLEGFGTEVGGSITLGKGIGGGMIMTGEANDIVHYYGGYVSVGGGASLEGHVNITETTQTYYPIEYYTNLFNLIYQVLQ